MSYYGWKPYVPVAARRAKALREMEKLGKKGHPVSPVTIDGRAIADTFWGKAWCDNLERYSDFENRLPRGRTYVRNGSVVDLQIKPGVVQAVVSGSELYKVAVKVSAVPDDRYEALCKDCAGAIDSLVELLQGRFSKGVMERICREGTGLFPAPDEIEFKCSCPDWAYMCKHVAAVLYGIGSRFDTRPELLFILRQVDEKDLIAKAGEGLILPDIGPAADKVLADEGLSEIFGLDLAKETPAPVKEEPSAKALPHRKAREIPAKVREKRTAKPKRKTAKKNAEAAALKPLGKNGLKNDKKTVPKDKDETVLKSRARRPDGSAKKTPQKPARKK